MHSGVFTYSHFYFKFSSFRKKSLKGNSEISHSACISMEKFKGDFLRFSVNFLIFRIFRNLLNIFRYCVFSEAKIFVTTFNVNGRSAPRSIPAWLVPDRKAPDIYVVGYWFPADSIISWFELFCIIKLFDLIYILLFLSNFT